LTLDDEMQYRCAGYIQAEIERFAELLEDDVDHEHMSSKRGSDDEQVSGEDDKEENGRLKAKEKEKRSHKHKKEGTVISF